MNVKFFSVKLKSTFDAIETKDNLALYWIIETSELYKGDQLFGTGAMATKSAAGLLSAEDKAKLDALVAASGIANLTAVDGTIKILDTADGKSIGVALSAVEGNLITVKDDGLFASVESLPIDKINGLENRLVAIEKTSIGGVHYKGSVATVADLPADAVQGDLYEVLEDNSEWCFNGEKWFEYGYTIDFSPIAGDGIEVDGRKVSVKIDADSNGLVAVDGALSIALATKDTAGALSAVDKAFIDSIATTYATIDMVKETAVQVKYEISSKPDGTIVDYRDKEIRVMCPADTQWVKQNVGPTGNGNMYYMGFKAYAPEGAVSFKEDDKDFIEDQTMYYFDNNDFAGIDKFGRKYSIVWLGLATYDEATDTWTYFGEKSSVEKYIGWYYTVEWYDANGLMIDADQIRINLSNEDCHYAARPYYMANYATVEQITNIESAYSWGEL